MPVVWNAEIVPIEDTCLMVRWLVLLEQALIKLFEYHDRYKGPDNHADPARFPSGIRSSNRWMLSTSA